jgi:protocatechuate 3,4-dioxygenase beta subunit
LKLIAISILLAASSCLCAQETIVMQDPVDAHSLVGTVFDSNNKPLIGVSVMFFQCSAAYPSLQPQAEIKALAKTNVKGRFSIQERRSAKPYCLRFKLDGFNQYVVRVHLVPSAPDLRITMVPAA